MPCGLQMTTLQCNIRNSYLGTSTNTYNTNPCGRNKWNPLVFGVAHAMPGPNQCC